MLINEYEPDEGGGVGGGIDYDAQPDLKLVHTATPDTRQNCPVCVASASAV